MAIWANVDSLRLVLGPLLATEHLCKQEILLAPLFTVSFTLYSQKRPSKSSSPVQPAMRGSKRRSNQASSLVSYQTVNCAAVKRPLHCPPLG